MRILDVAAAFVQDLSFGLRMLRRSPGFAAAAAGTLALGIGATTAVFSVTNAVILRSLQIPESDRTMAVLQTNGGKPFGAMEYLYVEWRDRQECFELFAAALPGSRLLRDASGVRDIPVAQVSADFFSLAGVRPALGRVFTREEDQSGYDSVALLDHGFWEREFSASRAVLGHTISLGERPVTVIGVLPPGFHFPGWARREIWVPLAARPSELAAGRGGLLVAGRLKAGLTRETAQAQLGTVTGQIRAERTAYRAGEALVLPLRQWLTREVRRTFLMLAGAAAFLLLIACANLANLLLARGTGRRREMAVRASLGAGRARLAAQMLTESLLLAVLGGLGGISLAFAAVRAVPAIRVIDIPRAEEIAVDARFLLIGIAVSLASGILFGMAPALEAWRRDLIAGLRRGEASAGRLTGQRFRDILVAVQLALAVVLLSGAALMANTLYRLLTIDLGLSRSHAFTVTPFHTPRMRDRGSAARYLRDLAERIRALPGVQAASVANAPPLGGGIGGYDLTYMRGGAPYRVEALGRDVDPGYFHAAGIALLAGRDFEPADAARKPVPVILNRQAARLLFGAEDAVGKLVACRTQRIGPMEVIGVVQDARILGVMREPGPQAFVPLMGGWGYASVIVARGSVEPGTIAPAIRTVVRELDPGSPAASVAALDDAFRLQVAKPRFYVALLGAFAVVGLALASVGVYGVIAYVVAHRTQEFGVRLALGALPQDIVRMIVASGARVIAVGAAAGLAGALAATRLLSSLLFEVKPRDPLTLMGTVALMFATALLATWLAARRASSVDITSALRQE